MKEPKPARFRKIFLGGRIDLALISIPLDDGTVLEREVVLHPGSVAIVPLLPDNRVCLIRNHRFSVGQTLLEIPAGTLEPDEPPLLCASRELVEETGYEAGELSLLSSFFISPGTITERMHLYLARDLRHVGMRLEVGENIEPVLMDWRDAIHLAQTGQIEDAKTILALLLVQSLGLCQ